MQDELIAVSDKRREKRLSYFTKELKISFIFESEGRGALASTILNPLSIIINWGIPYNIQSDVIFYLMSYTY